jgi:hypothetical protein
MTLKQAQNLKVGDKITLKKFTKGTKRYIKAVQWAVDRLSGDTFPVIESVTGLNFPTVKVQAHDKYPYNIPIEFIKA